MNPTPRGVGRIESAAGRATAAFRRGSIGGRRFVRRLRCTRHFPEDVSLIFLLVELRQTVQRIVGRSPFLPQPTRKLLDRTLIRVTGPEAISASPQLADGVGDGRRAQVAYGD